MRTRESSICMSMLAVLGMVAGPVAQEAPPAQTCKTVHADLVEARSTTACRPGDTVCFLGEVDGNHGLRGTTYFKGLQGAFFPPLAPTFRSYVGTFEYTTATGTLTMKEMGLSDPPTENPESGVVAAYQKIVDATGEFAGASGYLFVTGFNRNQRIVTTVHGQICLPAPVQ